MNGTRKAGTVYFQHCIVVLYGSPPVMAQEERLYCDFLVRMFGPQWAT
ncbi:MAG: hypothetical protein ACTS6J_12470 [Burkholderiales bacterium]